MSTASELPPDPDEPDEPTRVPLAIEDWLTVIIMALLALITFANVLVRYFTSASFAWTEEVSVFLMIVLAMVAGSAAVARNRHIRIEYFADAARGAPARAGALRRGDGGAAVRADDRAVGAHAVGRRAVRRDLARHRRAAVVVHDVAAPDVGGHHAARRGLLAPCGRAAGDSPGRRLARGAAEEHAP
jgi:hypothetical protein